MDGCSFMGTAIGNEQRGTLHAEPNEGEANRMAMIAVKFTEQELGLLTTLAADQLFRREFIDPKIPGYKVNPAELNLGKKLVERLRLVSDRSKKLSPQGA